MTRDNQMAMATDISGLQEASGSELAAYQEIVRDEKSANCRARWPLLAQTAVHDPAVMSIATDVVSATGQRSGAGGDLAARAPARFDGVVRPAGGALGASRIAAAATTQAGVPKAVPVALPDHAVPMPLPVLNSVVARGVAWSPAMPTPRLKTLPVAPAQKPARPAAQAPRVARASATSAAAASTGTGTGTAQGGSRNSLNDLFKRLDAPQQRGPGPQS